MILKQSTAFTQIVGPILDSTGVEYTGAVIGDLSISKNGTEAAMASAATLTHVSNGFYTLVGTTGNSDTLGRLTIRCNKSTYQMPPVHFTVLTATAFDTLVTNGTIASTTSGRTIVTDAAGLVDSNMVKAGPSGSGTAQTTGDIYGKISPSTFPSGTISTLTQTQVSGGAYALSSASFVCGDTRIANLDATVSSRSTLTQTQVTGGAYSIQSSSAVLGDARFANLDAAVSSRSTLTQTQVTGGAYALNSASFSFNVQSGLTPIRSNTCQAGSTGITIVFDASASATDNLYRGARVRIVSGTGAGQDARLIESYVGSTQTATVKPTWITTPDNTSVFVIEAGSVNVETLQRSTTPVTNMTTVFSTDFATNYDATNDRWAVRVSRWGSGASQTIECDDSGHPIVSMFNFYDPVFDGFVNLPVGENRNLKADVRDWIGTAVATPDTAGYPKATIKSGTGTGEISLTSGGVSIRTSGIVRSTFGPDSGLQLIAYGTLDANPVSSSAILAYVPSVISGSLVTTAGAFYKGCLIRLMAGTGAGQVRRISDSSYDSGSQSITFTVKRAFITTPNSATTYAIYPSDSALVTDDIDADSIKADAVTEIQSGLSTLTAAGVRSAVGLASANLDTQLGTLATPTNITAATGIVLASNGLDSISTTAPTGVASNFREMFVQLWRRFFKRATKSATDIKTYADNGTTVVTTQAISSSGDDETQGAAS